MRKSIKQEKADYRDSNKDYFEATLQLRDFDEKQFNEIVDFIENNECKISKHIKQPKGVDIYLSSQRFIQKLARWIKKTYKCELRATRTLHTRDTKANKDLYRVTVFVRFLKISIGDIIEYNGEKVKITSIGKKPVGKILGTGKRIFLNTKLL